MRAVTLAPMFVLSLAAMLARSLAAMLVLSFAPVLAPTLAPMLAVMLALSYTGACSNACTSVCAESCTNTCTNACGNACTESCTKACTASCPNCMQVILALTLAPTFAPLTACWDPSHIPGQPDSRGGLGQGTSPRDGRRWVTEEAEEQTLPQQMRGSHGRWLGWGGTGSGLGARPVLGWMGDRDPFLRGSTPSLTQVPGQPCLAPPGPPSGRGDAWHRYQPFL